MQVKGENQGFVYSYNFTPLPWYFSKGLKSGSNRKQTVQRYKL